MFWASGALLNHDCMPEIKQKQLRDRKTIFKTLSLPVAKILSPVARQAPTKKHCECNWKMNSGRSLVGNVCFKKLLLLVQCGHPNYTIPAKNPCVTDVLCNEVINFRNPEKGMFAKGALRKFVANSAPNLRQIACIAFRTSEEGCTKLSQNCRRFESKISDNFLQIPLSNAPFSKFLMVLKQKT